MLKKARNCLAQKQYREAHALCMQALQADPKNGEAYFLLGVLTADHNNFAKALELFDQAARTGHNKAETHAQAARCLLALSRRDEAVQRIERAIESKPETAFTLDTIGVVLSRAGLHERAVAFYEAASRKAPDDAGYAYNLGAALQFMGDFDGARDAFDRAITNDPASAKARVARVSITTQTQTDNELAELEKAWVSRNEADVDGTLQLAHALAKTHEDLDRPAEAMDWLSMGKAEKLKTVPDRRSEDTACFEAAANLAGSLRISAERRADGPVFITGMPRTGTTLVDRILSSHPQITSAGELSEFSVCLKRATGTPGAHVLDPATLKAAASIPLEPVGHDYLARVKNTLGIDGRFTDKMPLNVFFVPAILAAIPGAQVICLRRHPADTVLSNYRQLFATAFSYYAYAYDLEWTADYVVKFNKLISEFEAELPRERFTIVDYEGLVADTEGETRRLLDHCGLTFDPACLSFHESAAPVATASATQVRQPIYTSSMGRWKRYRPAMDPALEILNGAGLLCDI